MAISILMTLPTGLAGAKSFVCDATISLSPTFNNIITSHPVEKSSNISDHVYNRNPMIEVRGVVSNSFSDDDYTNNPSLQYINNEVDYTTNRATRAYELIKELWETKSVFSIVGEHDIYNFCVLESFTTEWTKDTSDALIFTLRAQQIRRVSSQKVDVTLLTESLQDDGSETTRSNGIKSQKESGEFITDDVWEAIKQEIAEFIASF